MGVVPTLPRTEEHDVVVACARIQSLSYSGAVQDIKILSAQNVQ